MKWNASTPQLGDKKVRLRFALIPHKMHDGTSWVWLESYVQALEYKNVLERGFDDLYPVNRWIVISESCKNVTS